MASHSALRRHVACVVTAVAMLAAARPVLAQSPASGGRPVSVASGVDVASDYIFRGVRQNSTEIVMWPFVEIGINRSTRVGPVQGVSVRTGTWNSLHTGDTGSDGPAGQPWYESRLYGSFRLQFGRGVSVDTAFTAYTSPNDMFHSVKEIAVTVAADRPAVARIPFHAYALLAAEIDTVPGEGQLDGGARGGTYLELGAAPRHDVGRVRVTVPVAVGLSLDDYYELAGTDHMFGFMKIGGKAAVPIANGWTVHGGMEFQSLGETPRRFNGGDRTSVTAFVGVGVSSSR